MRRYDDEIYVQGSCFMRPKKLKTADGRSFRKIIDGLEESLYYAEGRRNMARKMLDRARANRVSRDIEEGLALDLAECEDEVSRLMKELSDWRAYQQECMNARQNPSRKHRVRYKKIPDDRAMEKLLPYIREEVRFFKEKDLGLSYVTVEDASFALRIPKGQVSRLFHKLNLQGLLSQKRRCYAHDTDRNPFASGPWSGWAPNVYYVREDSL